MRQFPAFLTTLALAFAVAACSPPEPKSDKFKVVTTFTVLADIAANVAGDAAVVHSITRPGAEIHNYQPTPHDILNAQDADLIFWNGLNLEQWFEKFLANLSDVPSAVLAKGIEPISIYQGPYAGKPNPHAWMSPENAVVYVENIRAALVAHDPGNAETYNKNAKAYSEKIKEVRDKLANALDKIPETQRWLVTSEGAFSYLARDFNLKEAYIWPINADQQGTPQQVRAVIDIVKENNVPAVFSESTVSPEPAKQVTRETNARYGGILYVDSLSPEGGPVPTYLDLLRVTTETIAQGLSP